jgi:twitching motility protein PilT
VIDPTALEPQAPVAEGELRSVEEVDLDALCAEAVGQRASDLHITAGLPPMIRVDGKLMPLPYRPMSPHDTQRLMFDVLSDAKLEQFEQTHDVDFSHGVRGVGRFRVNIYMQRDAVAAALRAIPGDIPTMEEINIPRPDVLQKLCQRTSGLVLVTGQTGSGKSTTLATMVDYINSTRPVHILTIEDPIEYLHRHKRAMVNQRELHADTQSFHNAMRSALREDPDVILVGEMRDLETIEAALELAETGHLVFGTLHTRNAPQTVDRIVDVFPPHQQEQIRVVLGNVLEAVIAQQLLPRRAGVGRLPVMEILICNSAARNLIREAKTAQIYNVIETGADLGMQTMDYHLAQLVRQGEIDQDDALTHCMDPDNFRRLLMSTVTRR